jgi:flavin reductase (DIM6/NTAB) family NADH-FMN oxidoreductase RutF
VQNPTPIADANIVDANAVDANGAAATAACTQAESKRHVHTIYTGPQNSFKNSSVDLERQYRDALGRFATGVTVITANTPDGPVGITVSSFASVSLNPALVLWSIGKQSNRYAIFCDAAHFAIHVLAEDQFDDAMHFVKDATTFDPATWSMNDDEVPVAHNALARFECARETVHDGGDHSIIVGRVLRFSQGEGNPLIYTSGKFGGFKSNTV